MFDCCLIVCLLADARPQRAIAESMVPRARPKGRALVRVPWRGPSMEGGNDPAVLHPARGVPQAGFTSGSFPQISISRSITNTRLWAIETRRNEHAKARPFPASDSPRRASRYAPLAGAASVACIRPAALPKSNCVPNHSLRRSLHGSGRSAPSRGRPLTARCGRCDESVAERTPAQGRTYQPSSVIRMPPCLFCSHRGSDHNWTVPPCSFRPYCNCVLEHPRRLRGRCVYAGCRCLKYVPNTDRPKPVNRYMGRALRAPRKSVRRHY
jgi:hypothetical protein